ncbi:hypothetical protein Hsero_2132 [Herbaspirillum seropedicae SmR1]|uniref:Uncharacterized protein n=1 Tax=Herbaspirillum seropedicae (strain SmR1) TaxID=757424 RepID=D8IT73_HERSS|nr:hypothetical protein Hsero_2132 [Herbaspirillum seropedicae SmR1]
MARGGQSSLKCGLRAGIVRSGQTAQAAAATFKSGIVKDDPPAVAPRDASSRPARPRPQAHPT